ENALEDELAPPGERGAQHRREGAQREGRHASRVHDGAHGSPLKAGSRARSGGPSGRVVVRSQEPSGKYDPLNDSPPFETGISVAGRKLAVSTVNLCVPAAGASVLHGAEMASVNGPGRAR